jgi:hypothetical protein
MILFICIQYNVNYPEIMLLCLRVLQRESLTEFLENFLPYHHKCTCYLQVIYMLSTCYLHVIYM